MKKYIISIFILVLSSTTLYGQYKYDSPTLGNLAIEGGIWKSNLKGDIKNIKSEIDFKDDLNYQESVPLTYFGLDIRSQYSWLPNFHVDYHNYSESAVGNFSEDKYLGLKDKIVSSGTILTDTSYSEKNLKAYGFLQQSIMEFNLGVNLKKITYEQTIQHADITDQLVQIKGPSSWMILPYIGMKIDLYSLNTVLKAETSLLSFGDDEARSYTYSINYRIMRHMYISYGFRYASFKTSNLDNPHEKYNVSLEGNYISAKILFN